MWYWKLGTPCIRPQRRLDNQTRDKTHNKQRNNNTHSKYSQTRQSTPDSARSIVAQDKLPIEAFLWRRYLTDFNIVSFTKLFRSLLMLFVIFVWFSTLSGSDNDPTSCLCRVESLPNLLVPQMEVLGVLRRHCCNLGAIVWFSDIVS